MPLLLSAGFRLITRRPLIGMSALTLKSNEAFDSSSLYLLQQYLYELLFGLGHRSNRPEVRSRLSEDVYRCPPKTSRAASPAKIAPGTYQDTFYSLSLPEKKPRARLTISITAPLISQVAPGEFPPPGVPRTERETCVSLSFHQANTPVIPRRQCAKRPVFFRARSSRN